MLTTRFLTLFFFCILIFLGRLIEFEDIFRKKGKQFKVLLSIFFIITGWLGLIYSNNFIGNRLIMTIILFIIGSNLIMIHTTNKYSDVISPKWIMYVISIYCIAWILFSYHISVNSEFSVLLMSQFGVFCVLLSVVYLLPLQKSKKEKYGYGYLILLIGLALISSVMANNPINQGGSI